MAAATGRCHLLELPSELRLAIYDLVFPSRNVDIWVDKNAYRWRSFVPYASLSLLATCSRIRDEASAVFHNNTSVRFAICDEFERPSSRYHRFAALQQLNAASFHRVRKVRLSLHTLTYPIFSALCAHTRGLLARLGNCANSRALEIHFEFWSNISDDDLHQIYETLCTIDCSRSTKVVTWNSGIRTTLYESSSVEKCLRMAQDDIALRRQGLPLLMQNPHIGTAIGPRELLISTCLL